MTEHRHVVESLNFDFPVDPDVINRLQTDPRMVKAMAKLRPHVSSEEQVQEVIRRAAAAKTKAELNRRSASWPKDWRKRAKGALQAVDTLKEFLLPYALAAPENSQIHERFHDLGDSLHWAQILISEELAAKEQQMRLNMPASQKRDDPTLAFCIILCGDLFELVGQPLCAFVGIVSAVAFGVPGQIDEKRVQEAWKTEKEKKYPSDAHNDAPDGASD